MSILTATNGQSTIVSVPFTGQWWTHEWIVLFGLLLQWRTNQSVFIPVCLCLFVVSAFLCFCISVSVYRPLLLSISFSLSLSLPHLFLSLLSALLFLYPPPLFFHVPVSSFVSASLCLSDSHTYSFIPSLYLKICSLSC